jgi:putative addiction module component (TIGR02574 family)
MATVHDLLTDALKLSEKDRARLAHELLLSLDAGGPDPDAEEEWDQEIARRAKDVIEGKAKTVPWAQVKAEIKQKLRR